MDVHVACSLADRAPRGEEPKSTLWDARLGWNQDMLVRAPGCTLTRTY
jgi:hypothetical protein